MSQISTKKLQRHKSLIIHKLAKKAWGVDEKGLLSRALFRDIVENVKNFLSKRIQSLSQEELVALLVDYLRISEYDVTSVGMIVGVPYVTTSLVTADRVKLIGYAIATSRWSNDEVKALLYNYPTADFYHVLALEGMPEELEAKVRLVTPEEILQIVTFIVVFDHFFDQYLHSILAMPGFKEYMYAYLEEQIGLTNDRVKVLDTGWERLKQ